MPKSGRYFCVSCPNSRSAAQDMVFFRRRIRSYWLVFPLLLPLFAHFSPAGKIGVAPECQIWYNKTVIITKTANSTLLKEGKLTMRPDTRSLLHGIFNLILPFFAYDLAGLLVFSLTVGDYSPWLSVWPMRILSPLSLRPHWRDRRRGALRKTRQNPRPAGDHLLRRRRGAVLYAPLPSGLYPAWDAGLIFL